MNSGATAQVTDGQRPPVGNEHLPLSQCGRERESGCTTVFFGDRRKLVRLHWARRTQSPDTRAQKFLGFGEGLRSRACFPHYRTARRDHEIREATLVEGLVR